MSSQGISALPTELVIATMHQIESPRDLFAFIRTSRRHHELFHENRMEMLVAIIKNAMPNGNVYIAIAACNAARTARLWWKTSLRAYMDSLKSFTIAHPRACAPDNTSLKDWALLLSLYKLWWISDYFISCFTREAFDFAAESLPLINLRKHREISSIERRRLQRALFRFEIFRRVYPLAFQVRNSSWTPRINHSAFSTVQRAVRIFFLPFSPWEREEILSIYEFLVGQIKSIESKLKDWIVLEISDAAQGMAARFGGSWQSSKTMPISKIVSAITSSDYDLFKYRNKPTMEHIQHFAARGLPFVKWLATLPPKNGIRVFMTGFGGRCRYTFLDGFRDVVSTYSVNGGERPQNGLTETLEGPNYGWEWSQTLALTYPTYGLFERHDMRRMGCLFWDRVRLRREWRFPRKTPAMRLSHYQPWDYLMDRNEPGIEYRFKNVPIPEEAEMDYLLLCLRASQEFREMFEHKLLVPFSKKEVKLLKIEY